MLRHISTGLIFFIFGLSGKAGVFLPEIGHYHFSIDEIADEYQKMGLSYLHLNPSPALPKTRYKINSRQEYQIKDWYQQDWFTLQKNFTIDVLAHNEHHHGESFNEAKRNVYQEWRFNKYFNRHRKTLKTPREWGGLTHPPLAALTLPLHHYSSIHAPLDDRTVNSAYFDPKLHRLIDRVSQSELSFGNKLTLLADRNAFVAKKALIDSAQESILMSSLVFVCDQGTREIVDLLKVKKAAGVDVRILTDATISKFLRHRECLKILRESQIEVIEADDFWNFRGRAIYHAKTLVVDFNQAIAGGHNMIDADNLSRGIDFKNRDVDLQVAGPMVTDMAIAFLEDWNHFAAKKFRPGIRPMPQELTQMHERRLQERVQGLRGAHHYPEILAQPNTRLKGVCRFIRQSPYDDRHSIGKAYLEMLAGVRHYLAITNPIQSDTKVTALNRAFLPIFELKDSFKMYNQLFDKIQDLAKRGKRIDLITTSIEMAGNENVAIFNEQIKEDLAEGKEFSAHLALLQIKFWNGFYGKRHYKNLLQDWLPFPNVHIWTHISFMHSKVFHFDRLAASIGSYNFQHNATDHAFEVTSICQDTSLNQQLDQVLVLDMANSIPLIFKQGHFLGP